MTPDDQYLEPKYTIGVASNKLGISVHSLRQYEREGLILSFKTPTGRRLYSDLEIEKIHCIKKMLKEYGLNFEGIRRLLALTPCWKMRECSKKSEIECAAYKNFSRPCWSTEEKCHEPLSSCRICPVYYNVVGCDDIKKFFIETPEQEKQGKEPKELKEKINNYEIM